MKVLVAEDERSTRLRITAYLEEWGYEVIEAADGAEAWEKFQQVDPGIIITDWLMPGMDGLDLIRKIRSDIADPTYHYIILLTARSEMKDVVEGLEAGADDFVSKPFDKDELRVRVQAGRRIISLEHALEQQNEKLEASNREIMRANTRMRESLLSAATIQESFLPPAELRIGQASFASRYQPCEELAGDTMNVLALGDDNVAIYTIDVSGHGVPAALLSVHVSRILTRTRGADAMLRKVDGDGVERPMAPADVLGQLNGKFLFDTTNQQYFTMIYGLLNLRSREFRYCSAGHPGPILLTDGRATILSPRPPAIGFLPNARFIESTLALKPGDRLLFYTDGIFEATDSSDAEFGEDTLAEAFASSAADGLLQSLDAVIAKARDWRGARAFDDDISMLAVEIG